MEAVAVVLLLWLLWGRKSRDSQVPETPAAPTLPASAEPTGIDLLNRSPLGTVPSSAAPAPSPSATDGAVTLVGKTASAPTTTPTTPYTPQQISGVAVADNPPAPEAQPSAPEAPLGTYPSIVKAFYVPTAVPPPPTVDVQLTTVPTKVGAVSAVAPVVPTGVVQETYAKAVLNTSKATGEASTLPVTSQPPQLAISAVAAPESGPVPPTASYTPVPTVTKTDTQVAGGWATPITTTPTPTTPTRGATVPLTVTTVKPVATAPTTASPLAVAPTSTPTYSDAPLTKSIATVAPVTAPVYMPTTMVRSLR